MDMPFPLRAEYNQTCHNSIRGTDAIAEVNQTPARRVIDLSNTGQDLNTFRGTADAIAPRRDLSILPVFRGTTNSNSVKITFCATSRREWTKDNAPVIINVGSKRRPPQRRLYRKRGALHRGSSTNPQTAKIEKIKIKIY